MADYWVCASCRSINRPNASKCYSCRARRDALPTTLEVPAVPPGEVPEGPSRRRPPAEPAARSTYAPPPPPPRSPEVVVSPSPFERASPAPAAPEPPTAAPEAETAPQVAPEPRVATAPEAAPTSSPSEPSASEPTTPPPAMSDVVASMVAAQRRAHRRVVLERVGRGLLVAVVVIAVVAGAAAFVMTRPPGPTPKVRHTIAGRLDLVQARPGQPQTFIATAGGASCSGIGAYRDVRLGMPVTVETADGAFLGQGWLEPGEVVAASEGARPTCSFPFSASVADASDYRLTPGTRDPTDTLRDELESAGWEVTITLD